MATCPDNLEPLKENMMLPVLPLKAQERAERPQKSQHVSRRETSLLIFIVSINYRVSNRSTILFMVGGSGKAVVRREDEHSRKSEVNWIVPINVWALVT